jgi:hypothetical protein
MVILLIKAVCFTSHAYRYSIVYMCKYWLYEQNGRSKLFNLDFVWVTLEYGLFFLNCYKWCKFPFNGITVGMWGKTHCKLSRNSMHLSHSVNRVDSQVQPELGYMHPPPFSEICHQSQTVKLSTGAGNSRADKSGAVPRPPREGTKLV